MGAPPAPAYIGEEKERLVGLARETLSALLVLSWSDSSSLETAAAVDTLVTDAHLADSVTGLWRRATEKASGPELGALSSSALAMMSSISCRSTGRQALVASGAASAVVDVALRRVSSVGGKSDHGTVADSSNRGGGNNTTLEVTERAEVVRLLCVLCATPAHRVSVRASLATLARRHGVVDGAAAAAPARTGRRTNAGVQQSLDPDPGEQEEEEGAVEAAVVGIWGGASSGEAGYAEACRLALLLGVSPPHAPIARIPSRRSSSSSQQRGSTTPAGAGAFAAGHLSSPLAAGGNGRRVTSSKSPPDERRSTTSATTDSPSPPPPAYREIGRGGGGARSGGGAAAGVEDDTASINSQDLEEALYPSTSAAPASSVTIVGASLPSWPGRPGVPVSQQRIPVVAAAAVPASAGSAAPSQRGRYTKPLPPPPTTAPSNTRSESEESLHRLLSEIAKSEQEENAAPTTNGSFRGVATTAAEERDRVESRRAGAGLYGSGGGGASQGGQGGGDDRVACGSCGKLVHAPRGFDLALIDCPHCRQAVG